MNSEFAPIFKLGRFERLQLLEDIRNSLASEDDEVPSCLMAQCDIPDRNQMEQEQSRLCKRMAHMISLLGVYDLNIQTGEGLVSEEYVKLLGYSPSEFQKTKDQFLLETGPQWLGRIHPDDKDAVSQTLAEYTSGRREAHCIAYRQRTKSGGWISILSTGKLVLLW